MESNTEVAIIDYGCGNLKSVNNALEIIGASPKIITRPEELSLYSKIILPGVGSFDYAMEKIEERNYISVLKEWVRKEENKLLGICLGMQILCRYSDESQEGKKGLGLIDAEVKCLATKAGSSVKIPHMGWNEINISDSECCLVNGVENHSDYYFVHSYGVYSDADNVIVAETTQGSRFASIISNGSNIFGVQFHPEKSQGAGLKLLRNFVENA